MKKLLLALILTLLTFSMVQAQTLLGTFNIGTKIASFEEPVGYSVELIWRGKVDDYRAIVEVITSEDNPLYKPGDNVIFRGNSKLRYIIPCGCITYELLPNGNNQVTVWEEQ